MTGSSGSASSESVIPGGSTLECDVVMKGGITSGVVYPGALETLSRTYRFRGLGGASAGAIGAALGAAAEHGRANGAFQRLGALPAELGNGKLMSLFQAERETRPILRLMLAATSANGSKTRALVWAVLRSFPIACLLGVAPGVAAIVLGARQSGGVGVVLVLLGVLAALIGLLVAVLLRAYLVLTRKVTANNFGICTGLRLADSTGPGFTDWLADKIDDLAGVSRPLTFGQLWTGTDESKAVPPGERDIDLRMVTTCLSESQPFEMPSVQGRYFFDAKEWGLLFPEPVVAHLVAHHRAGEPEEDARLAAHQPPLTRMPLPEDLPVIVATRMSLSFPLLISAIPMWTIDRRKDEFVKVWFTDGGLCNNFPVQLFDAALPTRPTFAINLGRFGLDSDEKDEEVHNVRFARDNRSGIAPRVSRIPSTGRKAITGFAGQAFNSARNWSDVSQLDQPGYRDRVFEVLQTKLQGGMNLDMQGGTIGRLAARGAAAGAAMVDQFTQPHYRDTFTGWDNHRWIRYRATLAAFPDWLASFKRGFEALNIAAPNTPSVDITNDAAALATTITDDLTALAGIVAAQRSLADL
ncbi:MAG TPA: hypothetical protein VLD86_16860, partial [Ilumatobacteraceae bacterium]|nr:hypothetical protein [Ilumatobacteraceae bacterium]